MATGTIPRSLTGNTNWNSNGTHTVYIGTGTYLLLLRRPNANAFELFALAQNYVTSLVSTTTTSIYWDSVSFNSGTFSINVKDTYCAASWVKLE